MELANKCLPVRRCAVEGRRRDAIPARLDRAVLHYATISLPALVILLLVFFADIAAPHMHLGDSRTALAATPIVFAAVCCVPALGTVALA